MSSSSDQMALDFRSVVIEVIRDSCRQGTVVFSNWVKKSTSERMYPDGQLVRELITIPASLIGSQSADRLQKLHEGRRC